MQTASLRGPTQWLRLDGVQRRAATLVELLVTLGVIGMLTGLLLPAVQMARESARRMQCEHHLHQIGLGLMTYHDHHRKLPPGCLEWRPFRGPVHRKNLAWSAFLLPFIDQPSLHQSIRFDLPFDHQANRSARMTTLAIYRCPSVPSKPKDEGFSDYGGLYGQRISARNATDNGCLVYDQAFDFADLIDGLNDTMLVSEDSEGPDSQWINGSNVFEQSGGVNDPRAWRGDNEIRSRHPGGAVAVFGSANVRFLSNSISRDVLAAWITRAGGEVVEAP
ncbi:MAG: DUF1559 domain-containing protein [Pirellulaceae bacterium]